MHAPGNLKTAQNRPHALEKSLLSIGELPDAQTKYGETALMRAARFGHAETVKILLKHGADTEVRSEDGETAADLASKGWRQEAALVAIQAHRVRPTAKERSKPSR